MAGIGFGHAGRRLRCGVKRYKNRETPISINKSDIPEGCNVFYIIEKNEGGGSSSQLDLCPEDYEDEFIYSDEEENTSEEEMDEVVESTEDNSSPDLANNQIETPKPKVADQDADGIPDSRDNCIRTYNPDQKDSDGDGQGDVCDKSPLPKKVEPKPKKKESPPKPADADKDGVPDFRDNCRSKYNPDQKDSDGDGIGDVCDSTPKPVQKPTPPKEVKKPVAPKPADTDKDGVPDANDNCRTKYNPDQKDSDADGIGDVCDATPLPPKKEKEKPALPPDADNDGVPDDRDNCVNTYNPDQKDSDGDGEGDPCDETPVVVESKAEPVTTPNPPEAEEEPDFLNKAYAGNRLRKKCADATEVSSSVSIQIQPKQNFELLNAKVVSKGYGKLTIHLKEGSRKIKSYNNLSLIPGKREIGFSGLYEYLEKGKTYTLELIPSGTSLMSMAACEKATYSDMRVAINQPQDGVVLFDLFINY